MKILYAIQGTGNGHISRAREIIPYLMEYGEVDIVLSGHQAEVSIPYPIQFRRHGVGYTFGTTGGIDFGDSLRKLKPLHFFRDIYTLPVHQYHLVISDFEPVTAWACKVQGKHCVALSHQASFLSHKSPRPSVREPFAEWLFRNYSPCGQAYGFHFSSFDTFIHTPVIRQEVRRLETTEKNHITVYLPAHADELLLPLFQSFQDMQWHIFSKHSRNSYTAGNCHVQPVSNDAFLKSMASGAGVITAGGFESVAEAIYLRKKVMVIPMKNQYEQECNAEAAKSLGVTRIREVGPLFRQQLKSWLEFGIPVRIQYPDHTASIIAQVVRENIGFDSHSFVLHG